PTVAGLAQRIEQAMREGQGITIPPLVPVARPAEIPLSFAQQRLWFLDQLDPNSTAYLVPRALRLQGQLQPQALEQSLQMLVYRHESLRTTFAPHADHPVQIIHSAGPYTLPVIDLQELRQEQREEEAQRLMQQEAQSPMNLATGPLLR